MGELRNLAHFLVNLLPENVPEHVKRTANLCVLDTMGAAMGALSKGKRQYLGNREKGSSDHRQLHQCHDGAYPGAG